MKMFKSFRKRITKDNKGFSLVELIVVIAIMAVLVGVIAPQAIGYVKKSKVSTDLQNANAIASSIAIKAATASEFAEVADADKAKVTATVMSSGTIPAVKAESGYEWYYSFHDGEVHVFAYKDASNCVELYPTTPTTGTWSE